MARVTLAEVQGWLDSSKLTLASLDAALLAHMEEELITRLAVVYDTSTWVDETTTPKLVRTAISKFYASWLYDRFYSENQEEGNDYALRLAQNVESIMTALIDGRIVLPEVPDPAVSRGPSFYPTDASSAQEPTSDDPSLGGPYFSLGRSF